MGNLRWFNKSSYTSLGEALGLIAKELKALQPTDSSSVVWSKTAAGLSASIRGKSFGSNVSEESDDTTSGTKQEYNGYFTIKILDQTEDDNKNQQLRVAVCDGETWDKEKETSDPMYARVNGGTERRVKCTILGVTPEKPYILLRFFIETGTLEILTSDITDDKFEKYHNYLIGEIDFRRAQIPKVIQRHGAVGDTFNGVANIWVAGNYCIVGELPEKGK